MDGRRAPWAGDYHADMNVQEIFWPACTSGHLDLLDSWCDYMKTCVAKAQAFNDQCGDIPGTAPATVRRFTGNSDSDVTATVCMPES